MIARLAVWCLVLGLLAGCNRGMVYRPDALPPELAPPPLTGLSTVDLSRLAMAVGDSEMIYPGDVVAVTISTGLETEKPAEWTGRIAEDGLVNIPLVGPVPLAGLKLPQAEFLIHQESVQRGKFVNPTVTVVIATRRSNNVTVVGEVEKPGTYQLPASNSNVLAAITAAEGMTKDADTVIEVRHSAPDPMATAAAAGYGQNGVAIPVDLASYRRDGAPQLGGPRSVRIDLQQPAQLNPALLQIGDGSTVMVMKRAKRYVHVIGLVRKPDQLEMPDDQEMRLLDAIAKAQGRTLEVADKVRVIRNVPNRPDPVIIEASISEAKQNAAANIRLAPGDVVSVEETAATLVVGTVRDFVRFGFTAGIPGL